MKIKTSTLERQALDWAVSEAWEAAHPSGHTDFGPTPLIAAMRAFVASRLGDELEVPDELA